MTVAEGTEVVASEPPRLLLLSSGGQQEEPISPKTEYQAEVLRNQRVLRVDSGIPPVEGKDIFGVAIPGEGSEALDLRIGVNLDEVETGTYAAAVEGTLHVKDGQAWVVPADRDASIEITTTENDMKALLTLHPALGTGRPVYVADVRQALAEEGVIYGVNQSVIEAAVQRSLKEKTVVTNAPVARGTPVKPATPEDVTLKIRLPDFRERYWIKADGKVDFYNLERIVCVEENEVLAELKPSTPGRPGKSVRGQILNPPKPEPADLLPGDGVTLSEDGRHWIAKVSGQVHQEGRYVHVRRIYMVDGNLDFATGNVTFVGDVLVRGDVEDGFSIRAGGDITVTGSVGVTDLDAKGDIQVGLGISGKERATVRCDGNLVCSYLQDVSVRCAGDLVTATQIVHSDVRVGGKAEVLNGKGTVVGGSLFAGKGAWVKSLGSEYEVRTEIEVGSDYRCLEAGVQASEEEKSLKAKLATLIGILTNVNPDADPELLQRAKMEAERLRGAIEHAKRRGQDARVGLFVEPIPFIEVQEDLYSNVHVRIREARRAVRKQSNAVRIHFDKDEEKISISSMKHSSADTE